MPLDPDFYDHIYEVVRLVPEGRVTTYGHIARCLGSGRSARIVGYAMNQCHHVRPKVPAHRVVNRNGLLTGKMHFASPTEMQNLLEAEGVVVQNDQVQHFEKLLWDPASLADKI